MKKILIKIPDNLSPSQELLAIAKELGKGVLQGGDKKLLGDGYEIKHLETQITVRREQSEKPIVTKVCGVCQTIFEQKLGKKLWVNYGGKQKQQFYCTDECRETILQISGNGRAATKRSELTLSRS